MSVNLLTKYLLRIAQLYVLLAIFVCQIVSAQEVKSVAADTLQSKSDTIHLGNKKPKKDNPLKSKVTYKAKDSLNLDVKEQQVHLYGDAELHYEDISLKAYYVMIDFKNNTVIAHGRTDSTGKEIETPEFSEGDHTFRSKKMVYNFDTKKGVISNVITQEGEGFIHGNTIKKMDGEVLNIHTGKYTTCNLDHPHFEFRFTKSKVIPDDKIITGPAYMSIADVPTPLVIPFGLFPNKKGQRSGLLLPSYGESAARGFYFENLGYYLGLSKYMDLEIRSDIYTLGSWAVKTSTRYAKKYRYNGYFNVSYAYNKIGVTGSTDYKSYRDYSIRWSHTQSEKAWPNSRFSANVNMMSSNFNQFNPVNTNAYLSNTFQSSVSYQTNWNNKYFLNASLNHNQNTIEKTVTMTLPDISFSVSRINPFARKNRSGAEAWYEKISLNYQTTAQNNINTYDSLLFTPGFESKFRNGMLHTISASSPLKLLKFFVLTNSINYKERWYTQKYTKQFDTDTIFVGSDTISNYLATDTTSGFFTARDVNFSSSVSTTVYGMLQFKRGPLKAIRHVLTPSVSFTFAPGYADKRHGYYNTYLDTTGRYVRYSSFQNALYGTPPELKSGRLNFNLSNNLEIKVRSFKDTVSGTKKIPIVENFSLSTSYDLAKDSLKWSPLTMSGRTRIFKKINISYSSTWDPYVLDSAGKNINKFEWTENQRFVRLKNTGWSLSLDWNLTSNKAKSKPQNTSQNQNPITSNPNSPIVQNQEFMPPIGTEEYVDFKIPWSLMFSYSLRYGSTINYLYLVREKTTSVIQTLTFSGEINITQGWKVGMRSGYDFKTNKLTYTSLDFYRDLHCWEMRMNWVPIGARKSWNFTINVKSSVLQDLKLNKKKDFRDY